jgi:hypothetical protein
MKLKIYILGTFLVIYMFLAINISWADDPIPRSRTLASHESDRGKSGTGLPGKGLTYLNKAQWRYEKAGRKAWADGKLTYHEMRRLHQIWNPVSKDIKHHKGNHRDYNRGYLRAKEKRPVFPRFSIDFSFSKPWIH